MLRKEQQGRKQQQRTREDKAEEPPSEDDIGVEPLKRPAAAKAKSRAKAKAKAQAKAKAHAKSHVKPQKKPAGNRKTLDVEGDEPEQKVSTKKAQGKACKRKVGDGPEPERPAVTRKGPKKNGEVAATFARRVLPANDPNRAIFLALRKSYEKLVAAHVSSPSTLQDKGCSFFKDLVPRLPRQHASEILSLQDPFWKYARSSVVADAGGDFQPSADKLARSFLMSKECEGLQMPFLGILSACGHHLNLKNS